MKQKEIFIDSALNSEIQEMIRNYFLIKTVSEIQGFVFSEEEILKKYKNTYTFNNFKSANYYAVYTADRCENCLNPFEVLITNRRDIYNYLGAENILCNGCKIFHSVTERVLGSGLDRF